MAHISKGKVTFSVFAPRRVNPDLYANGPYKVGLLLGRATSISERTDERNDETYVGLRGSFRAFVGHDAMPGGPDSVSSGICYMPDAWQGPIIDQLRAAKDAGVIGASVDFVYEVCLGKRGEDAYEWIVKSLIPASAADPLEALSAQADIQAIEGPKPDAKK